MNHLNQNIEFGICICAFPFGHGDDHCDVYIYEHPDINEGYIAGWIVVIDTIPHFVCAIEEWRGLSNAVAHLVGQHFGLKYKNPDNELEGFEDDDDFFLELDSVFCEAMYDSGFIQDNEGGWEYQSKRKKAIKVTKKRVKGKKKCLKK